MIHIKIQNNQKDKKFQQGNRIENISRQLSLQNVVYKHYQ